MTWYRRSWFASVLSNVEADTKATRLAINNLLRRQETIERKLTTMAAREDQAYADLNATIQTVKDGWASLIAERDALKAALENADANAAAEVRAALDADSDVDAGKVEAADAALAELVAPAPVDQPPADEPPADGEG